LARSGRSDNPRTEDIGETRQAILRAAHSLFMANGYRAVSTRQIADACGLTQPALYRHFSDKQELYVATLEGELDAMRLGLERIAARATDVCERLRQVIRFMPTTRQELSQMFHDIAHELDEAIRQRLQISFERSVIAPIAAIFEDGINRGALRDTQHGGAPPVAAAYLFLSMLDQPPNLDDQERGRLPSREQRADMIVGVLLHGLSTPEAANSSEGMAPGSTSESST